MAANGNHATRANGPRCIALVGPFQSGKTTLLEAILARTGAIARQGSIEARNTVGDGSKEARDHRMSVELTQDDLELRDFLLVHFADDHSGVDRR